MDKNKHWIQATTYYQTCCAEFELPSVHISKRGQSSDLLKHELKFSSFNSKIDWTHPPALFHLTFAGHLKPPGASPPQIRAAPARCGFRQMAGGGLAGRFFEDAAAGDIGKSCRSLSWLKKVPILLLSEGCRSSFIFASVFRMDFSIALFATRKADGEAIEGIHEWLKEPGRCENVVSCCIGSKNKSKIGILCTPFQLLSLSSFEANACFFSSLS